MRIEERVTILETKMDSCIERVEAHEERSEKIFAKISDTLDDIRDEIKNFAIEKNNLSNDLSSFKQSTSAVWRTLCYVAVTMSVLISALFQLYKQFVH